jgi:RNA polymerase sigma-70 factor (ECF subfamily)
MGDGIYPRNQPTNVTADERASFERTFRQHYAELCDFAAFYVGSADDAEEVVQDVFFAIWLRREDLEARVSMRSYLFGAVRNHALHNSRHAAIVRRHAEAETALPTATGQGLDEIFEGDEAALELRRAIKSLPPRTRLAMELRWLRQMSYAEVAEVMRISVKAVEKLITGGMKELRAILFR